MLAMLATRKLTSKAPLSRRGFSPDTEFWRRTVSKPSPKYTIEQAIENLKTGVDESSHKAFNVNINLNLDPRIEGQKLQGVFDLPHGIGKSRKCAAISRDEDLQKAALEAGATVAVGDDILHQIRNSKFNIKEMDVVVASFDAVDILKLKKIRSRLKKSKLTPVPEQLTLVEPADFVETVRKYSEGKFTKFQTDTHGNVAVRVGGMNFEPDEIIENFDYILKYLFDTKPEEYGTGPRGKKKNIGKYVIGIHLNGDGRSLTLDLASIKVVASRQRV